MRTKNFLKHLFLGALLLTTGKVVGQSTTPGNVALFGTDFLGWDNTMPNNNFPLMIRHDLNQPIEWFTDNTRRMRLQESASYGIGAFPNQQKYGSLLLCPKVDEFYYNGARGPFSLLHLAADDHNAQQGSYRPWMNVGVNFTGNDDQAYIGQKYRMEHGEPILDFTDMVAHWSDNPGDHLKDRFRFIFTSGYDPHAVTGAQSEEGLEFLRMWAAKYDDPRIGIGDWYAANLADPVHVTEPTERLDIVNGRVRIRQLPDDPEAEELTKFLVVDDVDPNSDEYGVVKWRHLPVVPPATSCDWTLNPTTHNNVSTAFGPADPDCPDDGDAVGIGVDLGAALTEAKLNVASLINGIPVGINVEVNKPAVNPSAASLFGQKIKVNVPNYADAYGLDADVTGHGYRSRGVRAVTKGTAYVSWAGDFTVDAEATYSVGVHGSSTSGTAHSVGVHGVSSSETNGNYGTVGEVRGSLGQVQIGLYGRQWSAGPSWINPPSGNYGLFATTEEQANTGSDWAGWFRGNVTVTGVGYIPGGTWISSDENLKANIADIPNAMSVITQLNPKSYDYLVAQFPQVGLPSGQQYGFLAQELEQVIPESVRDITFQATLDSTGQELYPAVPTKIMNTAMVIPFLVAAVKEQQATIAQLQDQVNNCCAAQGGMVPEDDADQKMLKGSTLQEQRLLIIPNPVADLTMLEYYVPTAGKVSLSVSTSDGKPLGTLREEQAEAGAYSYPWNTTKLAAGTYFCTYMLDGAVVVKRAVKVGR